MLSGAGLSPLTTRCDYNSPIAKLRLARDIEPTTRSKVRASLLFQELDATATRSGNPNEVAYRHRAKPANLEPRALVSRRRRDPDQVNGWSLARAQFKPTTGSGNPHKIVGG